MKVIEYLLNDHLLLLEVEEYGQELVAQVAIFTSIFLPKQVVNNPETKQQFMIEIPREYLGKPAIYIEDIKLELCQSTTLKPNQKKS